MGMDHEWNPEDVLSGMLDERTTIHPDESYADTAKRMFEENVIGATASLVHLALNSQNEKIRLDASKYIIERNLGSVNNPVSSGKGDPWDALLENVIVQQDTEPAGKE